MSTPSARDDLQRRKRELRLRIGRSRRRIDQRLRAIETHSRQLVSWRTYVSRSGLQWAESLGSRLLGLAGSPSAQKSRQLGLRLLRQTFRQVRRLLWKGVKLLWASTKSRRSPPSRQQSHSVQGAADE